jgi:NAD(P) transhydrogenase subunit alpha
MELIPRTTLAQKMDALSSQANLAGYAAVLLGSSRLAQILPMMMTPAGTIKPARVFVIGVGVAGLQAIATATRLGARVDAFDTRPVVEEQVKSLGARFVKANLGETGQTKDGYAQALTEEQQAMQRAAMADVVAESNLVITTAQVFGRKAPVIVTDAMIQRMRPGSVIVDVAVDSGGNVEGITPGEITESHGVTLVALPHLAREVPVDASEMYAANLANLIEHFWDRENTMIRLDTSDEIMAGCLVVHNGEIRDERFRK